MSKKSSCLFAPSCSSLIPHPSSFLFRWIFLVAGVLAPATDAVALRGDRLELFVTQAITHDDNVFRLSRSQDAESVLGTSSKGDTYSTTLLGFKLDVPVSRQRFLGGVTWSTTRYNRFTALDLDGHDGRAVWQWQVGNESSGHLGYTESRTLASLANVQSGLQSSTPNPIKTQHAFFDGAYRFTPRWRLRGEVSRLEQSNELPESQVNDVTIDRLGLTLGYVTPANNETGLGLGVEEGRYPKRQDVEGSLFDNAYRQQNLAVVADWTLTGRSHVSARAGRVSRSYDQLPERDFDGTTFLAQYDWQATGKLTLSAVLQRQISAVEEVNVGFVLIEGIALRPAFRLTEKISLFGSLDYSDREYLGDPGLVVRAVDPRTDRVRSASLTASYQPTRAIRLELAGRRETRSSTFPTGDYELNVVSAGIRIGF